MHITEANIDSVLDRFYARLGLTRLKKRRKLSTGIVDIRVRPLYEYKIINAKLVHKRTEEETVLGEVALRRTGLWHHMGWFTLPSGTACFINATSKHGEVYPYAGKYPSSPGLAMPGSAYFMVGEIVRC